MRYIFLAPLLLFVLIGGYFALGLKHDPSYIPSAIIDKPMPAFDLPAIEGYEQGFSSEDLAGKVALINFFGSWCVSCIVEHPMLMQIAQEEDIMLTGIDWKDKPGDGARWLARLGNPYAQIGDDQNGRTAIDFGITGAPETFVVDQQGRIRYRFQGPINEQIWEGEILPLIRQLQSGGDK